MVVVGASNIVGKPMALMLMQHETTVCICHAKTRDLAQFTLLADVLVVAAGYPNLILPQIGLAFRNAHRISANRKVMPILRSLLSRQDPPSPATSRPLYALA